MSSSALSFTHVLNAFVAKPGSEHDIAQRVTFASLRNCADYNAGIGLDAEVLAVVFPNDVSSVEAPAVPLPVLARSVLDIAPLTPPRMLPLLCDLLNAGYVHGHGTHLIYTNADIALQPHFYRDVRALIVERGEDSAFSINRRTLSDHYRSPAELPEMYADGGIPHPGHDCFVFPRSWVPRLALGEACIGAVNFDDLLIANLDALSDFRYHIYEDLHLTFHIGNERTWGGRPQYAAFNGGIVRREVARLMSQYHPPEHCHLRFIRDVHARKARRSARLVEWVRQWTGREARRRYRNVLRGRRSP